nr:NADH-quinone oxidoreductase subunit NuoE [Bacilli bacterium]
MGQVELRTEKETCCGGLERRERVLKAIERHRHVRGALIPVLHDIQDMFGYLPEEALTLVSEQMQIAMAEIYGVATFYSFFSLEPKGEHVIRVCLGTACYVKGSQAVLDKLSEQLAIPVGKTTPDGKFTLEAMRCLGACGLAPVLAIEDHVHGKLLPDDATKILDLYR